MTFPVSPANGATTTVNGILYIYDSAKNAWKRSPIAIGDIQANLGTVTTNITSLFANAATQATAIATLDANLGTVTTNITTLQTNAATQQTQINSLATNANANTAAYLPTYSGSIGGTLTTANQPSVTTLGGLTSFGTGSATTVAQGSFTVTGNLTIQGNTLTIGSNNLTVTDSIIDLHTYANLAPLISDDGRDIGVRFHYYKTSDKHAFLGWENATQALTYYQDATETNGVITGTLGNVEIGSLYVSNTTITTSSTTGALQVRGSAGIGGNIYVAGSAGTAITTAAAIVPSANATINLGSTTAYWNILYGNSATLNRVTLNSGALANAAVITGNIALSGHILPYAGNVSYNIGSTTQWWNVIYGKSTQAQYADLAENYIADAEYAPGTVLVFGGEYEVTITNNSHDTRVAGVVSTNPAYLMNAGSGNVAVAMTGRVPCLVQGPINKGTVLVTSSIPGVAQAIHMPEYVPGCVIGKALEQIDSTIIKTIEVVVGRF